ncbi:MAG: tail fiber domain-containing protein [Patescibacteria group bacterium]
MKSRFLLVISILLLSSNIVFARATSFSIGETTDPGADASPCGPLDANCFPSMFGGSTGQGWIYTNNGSTLLSSSSPTVNYITATSTTATSTFHGPINSSILSAGGTGFVTADVNGTLQKSYLDQLLDNFGLANLSKKFYNIQYSVPTIPVVGSVGNSVIVGKWTYMAKALMNRYGYAGYEMGWGLNTSAGVTSNTTDFTNWVSGFTYDVHSDDTVTFANPFNGSDSTSSTFANILKVYYVQQSSGGTFKIQTSLDGASWVDEQTVDSSGATAGVVVSVTKTIGMYRIRVLGVTGTSKIISLAARLTDSSNSWRSGIVAVGPYGLGQGGKTLANFSSVDPNILNPIMQNIQPDLLFFELKGTVDATVMPTYYNLFDTAYSTDWIILGTNPSSDPTTNTAVAETVDYLRQFAKDNNQNFLSLYDIWGTWQNGYDIGMQNVDGTHPTTDGYINQAEYILGHFNLLNFFKAGNYYSNSYIPVPTLTGSSRGTIYQSTDNHNIFAITSPKNYSKTFYLGNSDSGGNAFTIYVYPENDTTYPGVVSMVSKAGHVLSYNTSGNIQIGTQYTTQTQAAVRISPYSASSRGLWVNGLSGQTANLQVWTASSTDIATNVVASMSSAGSFTAANLIVSTTTATSTLSGGLTVGNNSALVIDRGATANSLYINSSGNIGIGTTSPSAKLSVAGSTYLGGDLTATGTVQFANFGAGSLMTDANGNVSVSSDERLKNIQKKFTKGLSEILFIDPINYKWNKLSGLDTVNSYTGFDAQNVQEYIPEAVGQNKNGYLTLSDRPILAAVVNAIKTLNDTVTRGIATMKSLALDALTAKKVTTSMLCVDDICVTKDEFKAMMLNAGQNLVIVTTTDEDVIASTTTEELSEIVATSTRSTIDASTTTPIQ